MRVRVLFFASLKDRTGVAVEEVEVPPGCDVAGLWKALAGRHPRLGEPGLKPAAACDGTYAGWDRSLDGVAEVAFLPPVSGG